MTWTLPSAPPYPGPGASLPRPVAVIAKVAVCVGLVAGIEEVDVLVGARHDYPASTTITYSRAGCGSEERWQPLEGRVGGAWRSLARGLTVGYRKLDRFESLPVRHLRLHLEDLRGKPPNLRVSLYGGF